MKRMRGRLGSRRALGGLVVAAGVAGVVFGITPLRARTVFLPVATMAPVPVPQREQMDSARVHAMLVAARGVTPAMCELAANVIDGRFGWWSSSDGFRPGGSDDPVASELVAWLRHGEVDAASVPLLRVSLGDSDWCVRRVSAPLLARVKRDAAGPVLLAALAMPDANTREMAALGLGIADDPRWVAPLAERLHDDAARVRATAAWALGEIERREAVRPLIAALADPDATVREAAARALGDIEDEAAVASLTDLLKSDRDARVRRAAAQALGEILG